MGRWADDSVIQIPEPELIWGVHFLKFKFNSGLRTFYFLDSQFRRNFVISQVYESVTPKLTQLISPRNAKGTIIHHPRIEK